MNKKKIPSAGILPHTLIHVIERYSSITDELVKTCFLAEHNNVLRAHVKLGLIRGVFTYASLGRWCDGAVI